MQRDQFIKQVQEIEELGSRKETEKKVRATFETLNQRLANNEPSNLAAQIPGISPRRCRKNSALAGFYGGSSRGRVSRSLTLSAIPGQ